MTHFLDINKTKPDILKNIINRAINIKKARKGTPLGQKDADTLLSDRIVALIFEKPSTRTRVSFDVGVRQMGGQTLVLSGLDMQLGRGETIADTARVMSRYVDLIMIRTFEETTLLEMAEYSTVPVINGLTNSSHPCQVMADIMTFEEYRGPIRGKKVVWSGDGNNVFSSFAQAAGQFGFNLTFTGPETLDPVDAFVIEARSKGVNIVIERNPQVAVREADLVVTDTWLSMHDPQSAQELRHNQLHQYQVNSKLMSYAKPNALFMHCLPAHREKEATSEVIDGPNSVIFDEAENRLHVQKAIMLHCLGL